MTNITMEYLVDQTSSHIKQECIDLDGLPADVLKIEDSNSYSSSKDLILLIPGNPGIVRFYSTFIQELYKELHGSSNVWAVSHSCHSANNLNKNDVEGSPLDIEIEHKLRFLEQKVPRNCRIILIGHSIGCYMILSLLEILSGKKSRPRVYHSNGNFNQNLFSNDASYSQLLTRIDKCYLLFPTIERMKVSPNGKRLWPVLNYLQGLIVGLITLVSWLPYEFRLKIASLALSIKCSDDTIIESTVNLITPKMFGNMLQLAHDELSNVNILDINSIQSHKDKLVFYFGTTDRWCPLSYRNDLIKLVPDIQNYIDSQNIEHAFVLTNSRTMATILAGFLNGRD